MNDELANDRTYLAWLRTGIALFGLGFVVARIALILNAEEVSHEGLYAAVGIVIILGGAALIVVGFLQHRVLANELRADDAPPGPRWPLVITSIAVASALLLSVLIGIST